MATEFPNSYKDPLYASLDAKTEKKLGLPAGLLSSIRLNGERSNNDQSPKETGAKSPYQFVPATRRAIIDKYGIDPLLSPENASEAAGLLLKESLDRNQGDPSEAVAEYHAGTNRANRGPINRAYVGRVMAGIGQSPETGAKPGAAAQERAAISRAYDAYRAGRMSPEDAAEFEKDVNAGAVQLPLGASLIRRQEASYTVPQSVVDAYNSGKMAPQDRAEFEADMRANPALVPAGVRLPEFKPSIPGAEAYDARPAATPPTLGEQVVGAGEAALATGTGIVGGTIGATVGTGAGLVKAITDPTPGLTGIQQMSRGAEQGAAALTYQPRTEAGQSQAAALGNVMAGAPALAGMSGELASLARVGQIAKPTAQAIPPIARNTAAAAAENVATAARAVPERVGQMMGREPATPTPGTMASGGSAAVDMATQRRMAAQDLPVPLRITEGMATRDPAQVIFEGETKKNPTHGAALRERDAELNQGVLRNMDIYFDQTGAEIPNLRGAGMKVDEALRTQAARDKTEIRTKYKEAEKAGELEAPVTLGSVVQHLNDSAPDAATAPVLDVARKRAISTGIATEGEDGALVANPVTLRTAETYRQAINRATNYDPTNVRQATIIKGLIDEQTDGLGGQLYKEARGLRRRYAENYENRALINDILNNKRGTEDRRVAFEDVFQRSIQNGSLDDVRNLRRVLHRGGEDGAQAWREMQGQAVNYIREQATKNVARDQAGNQIVSAAGMDRAIRQLDTDGKLDFIFGKRGAEQLRTINDVVNDIKTVPPGLLNSSNTASVLLAALDMGISGAGGMPLPIASGLRLVVNNVKDRRLRLRVAQALGDADRKAAAKPKPIEGVAPNKKRTIH